MEQLMDRLTIGLFFLKLIRPAGAVISLTLPLTTIACSYGLPDPPGHRMAALQHDAMEEGSHKLAGPKAVDCGRVKISENPKIATDCALTAFKADKPFLVRYDLQGIDSSVAAGLFRAPDGKVYAMSFDGDPMGGGGVSPTRQRFTTELCPQPVNLQVTENGRLNCFPSSDKQKRSIMSPTFSKY
jgi:hypothetical protein